MRIIVTGGSGFIGRHLCRALRAQGHEPLVIDRSPPEDEGVAFEQMDLSASTEIDRHLLQNAGALFHLAWTSNPATANAAPLRDFEANILTSLRLIERISLLETRPRLIFASTGGTIYGDPAVTPTPESCPARPMGAYALGKHIVEEYLELYHRLRGLDYLIFRPGNPYGPGQNPLGTQGVIAVFLGKMLRGETIVVRGDGSAIRDYLYIEDLVSALIRGVTYAPPAPDAPRVFNVGSGRGVALHELLGHLRRVTGLHSDIRYEAALRTDVRQIVLDCERSRRYLDWSPRTDLLEGLTATWKWLAATCPDARATGRS